MLEWFFKKKKDTSDNEVLLFLDHVMENFKKEGYDTELFKIVPSGTCQGNYEIKCINQETDFTGIKISRIEKQTYKITLHFGSEETLRTHSALYDTIISYGGSLLEEKPGENMYMISLPSEKRIGKHAKKTVHQHIIDNKNIQKQEKHIGKDVMTLAEIGGLEHIKKEWKFIIWGLTHLDTLKKEGGRLPRGVLLYGPPGCGKTYAARVLAHEARVMFTSLNAADFWSKWHMDAPNKLNEFFEECKKRSGSRIVYIDEIDVLAGPRTQSLHAADRDENRLVNVLLTQMDGIAKRENMVIIGSTNLYDPEKKVFGIDPALLRPGRFDKMLYVPPPDLHTRKQILAIHINKKAKETEKNIFGDIDLHEIAERTNGKTGADLEHIITEAIQKRIECLVATGQEQPSLSQKDLLHALAAYTPREYTTRKIGF